MNDFQKIIRPATIQYPWRKTPTSIYCKITYESGKLSISGVIGPKSNGYAVGGCGQIDMEFAHRDPADNDRRYSNPTTPEELSFTKGWTPNMWLDFLSAWKEYHLNTTDARCEHQRWMPEFDARDIEYSRYEIEWRTHENLKKEAKAAIELYYGGHVTEYEDKHNHEPFYDVRQLDREFIVRLKDFRARSSAVNTLYILHNLGIKPFSKAQHYTPERLTELIEIHGEGADPTAIIALLKHTTEHKVNVHTYPSEHPDGVLTKPCPVCGYRYGSAWRSHEVPESVLEFLKSLPDSDLAPAWV